VLTLAEEIVLLLLDDESGKLMNIDLMTLNYSMAGAVLMDLALKNRIDTDLDKLVVVDSSHTGLSILDNYLEKIISENADNNTRFWLTELSNYGEEILDKALGLEVDQIYLPVFFQYSK